jgi:peptide deformylase
MSETRTEYVVFIPDESRPNGRREVTRYPEKIDDEPGAGLAADHVEHLHRLAAANPGANRRGEAFAVEQVITITERRL